MKRSLALLLLALLLLPPLLGGCKKKDPYEGVENPTAEFILSTGGVMHFELHLEAAPNTVANFTYLANIGFYDGREFFRVVPGVLVQSGCPNDDGSGDCGYTIRGEFSNNGFDNYLSHVPGTLSMARLPGKEGYNSASSQFFIVQGDYPQFDGDYAAFGTAMDTDTYRALNSLANRAVDANNVPLERVWITSVRVDTHGVKLKDVVKIAGRQ